MPSNFHHAVDKNDDDEVVSPFAQTTSTIRPKFNGTRVSWPLWVVSAILALVILGNAAYLGFKYLDNPYRTMAPFSVDNYLTDFQPLSGSKFSADFKVVADLGWKENIGRLMVFTAANDSRPVLVLIPPKLSGIFFTKGQTYQVALEVEQGGLIYADSCEKD